MHRDSQICIYLNDRIEVGFVFAKSFLIFTRFEPEVIKDVMSARLDWKCQ